MTLARKLHNACSKGFRTISECTEQATTVQQQCSMPHSSILDQGWLSLEEGEDKV